MCKMRENNKLTEKYLKVLAELEPETIKEIPRKNAKNKADAAKTVKKKCK